MVHESAEGIHLGTCTCSCTFIYDLYSKKPTMKDMNASLTVNIGNDPIGIIVQDL